MSLPFHSCNGRPTTSVIVKRKISFNSKSIKESSLRRRSIKGQLPYTRAMSGINICWSTKGKSFFILLCAILITGIYLFIHSSNFTVFTTPKRFQYSFIPSKYAVCEDLFVSTSERGFSLSKKFKKMTIEFNDVLNKSSPGPAWDGHSGTVPGEYLTMHYLAAQPAANTACEVGFNMGHSAFNYLTANDKVVVHSFDVAEHDHTHAMSKYLAKTFPNRFFIHLGDSAKTIPKFIEENPGFTCDYMFVDGDHRYPAAIQDLKNFAKVANLEDNVIIFDDYPTKWGKDNLYGKAWEEVIKEGIVQEIMRCTFKEIIVVERGFALGRVVKRP